MKYLRFQGLESKLLPHPKATNSSVLSWFGWRPNFQLPRVLAPRDKLTQQSFVETQSVHQRTGSIHYFSFHHSIRLSSGCNNLSSWVPSLFSNPQSFPKSLDLSPEPGSRGFSPRWDHFSRVLRTLFLAATCPIPPHSSDMGLVPPCLMVCLG